MRRILCVLAVLLAGAVTALPAAQPPKVEKKHHHRGAKPTPPARIAAVPKHKVVKAAPASFFVVPSQLSFWYNDQTGDCVTAEEAFAKACASIIAGQPELFVPDAEVKRWAQVNGDWDGALLPDVMHQMSVAGFEVNGSLYNDGPFTYVDYTNTATLCNAIAQGPVKIGVASSQFDSVPGVGEGNGWFMTGFQQARAADEDHCVSLSGYGTLAQCFATFNKPVPAGVNGSAQGYLLFTWSGVGVIDEPSMRAITFEAYLRNPTTVGSILPPPPVPTPNPTPTPNPGPTPTPFCGPVRHFFGLCGEAPATRLFPLFPNRPRLFGARSGGCQ